MSSPSFRRRLLGALALPAVALLLTIATAARAQDADGGTCAVVAKVPVELELRQLSLDLLGRPPTIAEYRAVRARGSISEDDLQAMMNSEEFYARMRGYHRALFRANLSVAVYDSAVTELKNNGDAGTPLANMFTAQISLRGKFGEPCNGFIQQDLCDAVHEDPYLEPATKTCRDASGIPLPVSVDYSTDQYRCDRLDTFADGGTDSSITSCDTAVSAGKLDPSDLYFCDMRRPSATQPTLRPYHCYPDPGNTNSAALTEKVLEPGTGRVVAFQIPGGKTGPVYSRLDKCSLDLTHPGGVNGTFSVQRGCVEREGFDWTPPPFWDTTGRSQVAVCAIEAQARDENPWTLQSCESARFITDRSCGCGDRMRRCEPGSGSIFAQTVQQKRLAAFATEPELIADSVLRRDEPYFNILTTRRGFVNGTTSSFFHQNQGNTVWAVTPAAPLAAIPDLPYSADTTWAEYTRDATHSGVLTTPAFLLRFPTHRAQVAEFYDAFLCRAFSPPSGVASPAPDDPCNRENNLAKRCMCSYCHATLEPTGAYWGRFAERTSTYLDPAIYPRFDPRCRDCALAGNCDANCTANYITQAFDGDGASSLGLLRTYLYRTPSEEENIEGGPRLLVERMLKTGQMEQCTVKRVWKEFLGRPMSAEEEQLYLQGLLQGFTADHKLKNLIEQVVTTAAYRRLD